MGKTDNGVVLVWQGKDRGQQFIYGHCFFAYSILYNMQSWGCLLYTDGIFCIMLSFHKPYMYTLAMEGNSFRDSNLLFIADSFYLGWGHSTDLVHSTVIVIGESKLQSRSRNREEFKTLKGLRNQNHCIPLAESQDSLKDWLCTYLQLQWIIIFV